MTEPKPATTELVAGTRPEVVDGDARPAPAVSRGRRVVRRTEVLGSVLVLMAMCAVGAAVVLALAVAGVVHLLTSAAP
jgi:hypothetical protein